MNDDISPFPEALSDEAAFALSEVLHWLAMACDEQYFSQIRRHMAMRYPSEPTDPLQPWLTKPRME